MLEKLDLQVKGSLPTLLSVKNEKLHMRVIVLNMQWPNVFGLLKIFWNSKYGFCWVINMGDDIGLGLSSMVVCFDFRSTNVVQLSNRNPYFYWFRCYHPLTTQLSYTLPKSILSVVVNIRLRIDY